jgi:hypothetical protein
MTILVVALGACGDTHPGPRHPDAGRALVEDAPVSSSSLDAEGPDGMEPLDDAGFDAVDQASPCSSADCGDANPCPVDALPTVLGTLHSYGSGNGFATAVGFPAEDRVLFLSGSLLTLTKVVGDTLEELDRVQWGSEPSIYQVGILTWAYRPTVFILPLASKRVAVIGADWSIDVFDVSQDRLSVLYRYGFGSGGQQVMNAAASHGNDIWACSASQFNRYWLDDREGRIRRNPPVPLPARHTCIGLALSPDGRSLFAATSQGIDIFDISAGDGTGTLSRNILPGSPIMDVSVGSRAIGAYRLEGNDSGAGTIMVLDASDFSLLTTFSLSSTRIPAGITILPSGILLEEHWDEVTCRQVTAQTYSTASGALIPLAQFVPMAACRGDFSQPPVVITSSGNLVDLPPVHQVVRVDPTTGTMRPLHGHQQGSFDRVLRAGPGLVEVHGPKSMHLVDISDPTRPVVREGGLMAPMTSERLAVQITRQGQAVMLTVPSTDTPPSSPRTSLFWQREGDLPVQAGSIANPDPDALWFAAGTTLTSVAPVGDTDYRVRRISVTNLGRTEDQVISPEVDQTVAGPTTLGLNRHLRYLLAGDASSGEWVVAERRVGSAGSAVVFAWYAPDKSGYQMVGEASFADDRSLVDLGIAAGRALLLLDNRAVLLDRSGATLATANLGESGVLTKLLSFDDHEVTLAATLPARDQPSPYAVLVRRTSDLSLLGRYFLPEAALSMVADGDLRVFGTKSTLVVATSPSPLDSRTSSGACARPRGDGPARVP